jgi:hypothetical protein
VLTFEKQETKFWKIKFDDDDLQTNHENKNQEFIIELLPSSITNKFWIITNFIEQLSEYHFNEFDKWFYNLLLNAKNDEKNKYNIILKNIPQLKKYVDEYINHINFDYSIFVDKSKAKKNSILFKAYEIEMIMRLSSYLKIYAFIGNTKLKLGKKFNKIIFNELAKDLAQNTDVINKINSVISTRTFRYNMTDQYMWQYIQTVKCKDIESHIIEIFNFIMNYIVTLAELNKNPITYFVSVVDESIKWFLRSIYKHTIIYDDVSNIDIKTSSLNNLKIYTYDDTLERLVEISICRLTEIIEKNDILTIGDDDKNIIKFQNGLQDIKYISPLAESLTYPLMSKITDVPYNYFKILKPKTSSLISGYLYYILEQIFKTKYNNLFKILLYYPDKQPNYYTTYKIKQTEKFINNQNKIKYFMGFNTKPILYDKMCYIVGRLSRLQFKNIFDGSDITGLSMQNIELDVIKFYSNYFANNFEKEIHQMKLLINKDF